MTGDQWDVKKRDGVRDWRKCPAHNFWLRKGQCEICRLEKEAQIKEYEKTGGRNTPPVVIGTSDNLNKEKD